jgi:hypothetical protein
MIDKATVAEAIKASPVQAKEAMLAVQEQTDLLTMAGIEAAARLIGRNTEDLAADELERRGLLRSFMGAMNSLGVKLDADDAGIADANFKSPLLEAFLPRGRAFRCRVFVNGAFSGSGCLVSPSLVLTAGHVIVNAWPATPPPTYAPIEVELSDGTRRRAGKEPEYISLPTELEFKGQLPADEAGFTGYNDSALIRLERPDGMRLGFADLPPECSLPKPGAAILLLHYPQGVDEVVGFGGISKVRGITSRWNYTVKAAPGSSGGPCFNTKFALAGLHQGRWAPGARLVPASLFLASIREKVDRDIAPPAPWSLDGTAHGPLVIGRDLFFEAVAGATGPTSRVRGVRVKRRDVSQGSTGLAFSLEMLKLTLARNPGTHRTLHVTFDAPIADLFDEIRRRAAAVNIDVLAAEAGAGARVGETTLEANFNDRAATLAAQLNAVAESSQQLIWCLFENPLAGLGDAEHLAFEAFLAAALRQPRLRVVATGFETISTPGEEFSNAGVANTDGAPGVVVEYFGLFDRRDVEQLLTRACADFEVDVAPAVIVDRVNQILQGLNVTNLRYSTADLKTVGDRAVAHLDYFQSLAGARP